MLQQKWMYLPLLAGPQRPLGMVFVLAPSVGVNQKRELSCKFVSVLLRHVRYHQLIVVNGNEQTPFTCVYCVNWRRRRARGVGVPAGNGPPSRVSLSGWSVIMHRRPLSYRPSQSGPSMGLPGGVDENRKTRS